jgi:hypothetical protein
MTSSITPSSPNGARTVAAPIADPAMTQPPLPLAESNPLRRARPRGEARGVPSAVVVAACIAIHLLAAALAYRRLAGDLYAIFDATPRLLVLERGLTRLTAVTVFLPPSTPTMVIIAAVAWLGARRRDAAVGRWLAMSLVPLAVDGLFRLIGILVAPAPANVGELLDLPVRFSLGPRLVLDLAGVQPSPGIAYWVVVATLPAAISAWCVARAVLAAEDAERQALRHRRRRRRATIDGLQAGVAVVGTWIAIAFAGQVALPWAAQLFLKIFG